jgi:hypothetical protein
MPPLEHFPLQPFYLGFLAVANVDRDMPPPVAQHVYQRLDSLKETVSPHAHLVGGERDARQLVRGYSLPEQVVGVTMRRVWHLLSCTLHEVHYI